MDLKVMRNAVTSKVGRQILVSQKHSPQLMFVGGIVGVVATTVLACRATLKLEEVLDQADDDHKKADTLVHPKYSEKDRKRDHVLIKVRTVGKVAKLYAPAVGVGVVSVASLTGSHVVLTRRNVALTAAYSALERGFNEYRGRVREELGEDKEYELRHAIKSQEIDLHDPKKGEIKKAMVSTKGHPSIYARFFDETSQSWSPDPEYNKFFLQCQQDYANDKLRARGHVFLNEIYDALGITRSKEGAVVGWVLTKNGRGDNYIDFGIWNPDSPRARMFVNGDERSILLDFNVDGIIYDKI